LRSAAETLSVIERQRIVRLLVKDVLVGEDTITIRHSIPIPSGPLQNGGSEPSVGQNYLLCKGRDYPALRNALFSRLGEAATLAFEKRCDLGWKEPARHLMQNLAC
jgi:site-specific DNA recombinase